MLVDEGTSPFVIETKYGIIASVGPGVGAFVVTSVDGSVVPSVGDAVGGRIGATVGAPVGVNVVWAAVGVIDTSGVEASGAAVGSTDATGAAVGDAIAAVEHTHFATGKMVFPSGLTKIPSLGKPLPTAVSSSTRI